MAIVRLDKASDERLRAYTSLTNHQLRNKLDPQRGLLIAESEIAIRTALSAGAKPQSLLLNDRKLEAMQDVLATLPPELPVFVLPPDEARNLTGYSVTRGALCAMRRPQLRPFESILADARKVLVLEGITDTANVGAIFRNAAALGADAVIISQSCADPYSRRSVRVSMGNVFKVPWSRAAGLWPSGLMHALCDGGFKRLALSLTDDACPLGQVARELGSGDRVALFFGTEGTGLTSAVTQACDARVVIPMHSGVDSLNVAASTAIAMWELFGA